MHTVFLDAVLKARAKQILAVSGSPLGMGKWQRRSGRSKRSASGCLNAEQQTAVLRHPPKISDFAILGFGCLIL